MNYHILNYNIFFQNPDIKETNTGTLISFNFPFLLLNMYHKI